MLSKGGKIEYLCRHCNSPDIKSCVAAEIKTIGFIFGLYNTRPNYFCYHCGAFEEWKLRTKAPLKNPLPEMNQTPEMYPTADFSSEDLEDMQKEYNYVPTPQVREHIRLYSPHPK